MNNDMIEDDDIDLGSFGVKMVLLDLKVEIILMKMKMKMKMKMMRDEDDDDGSGGAFGSHDDTNFKYLYNK